MKVVLVTGGTGKIGSAIVLYLLKENYKVISTYNKSSKRVEVVKKTAGDLVQNLHFIQCDLSKISNLKNLFNKFSSKYSGLDLLINCAGVFPKSEFNKVSEKEYDYVMNLHLKSVYFLIQKFSKLMSENSVIINFSSVGGLIPWKSRSLYHISKAGVIALTKSLAIELAPKIRVVSIAPGFIESELFTKEKMPIDKIPLKRYGTIENILTTIKYILNNDYLTGITISVDGGRSIVS